LGDINEILAPAGGIITYHAVRFTQGEGDEITKYQAALSDAMDKEWAALYDSKFSYSHCVY
jgi:hypothetical protein